MKTIEAKNCMLEAYNRMGELVDAIGVINADTSKENSKEERHDNSNMDEFIISILCVELNELIEKLKNKL